jgi:hypothetical protein
MQAWIEQHRRAFAEIRSDHSAASPEAHKGGDPSQPRAGHLEQMQAVNEIPKLTAAETITPDAARACRAPAFLSGRIDVLGPSLPSPTGDGGTEAPVSAISLRSQ